MPKGYPGTGKPKKTMEERDKAEGQRDTKGKFAKGNSIGANGRPVLGRSLAQLIKDVGEETVTSSDGKMSMTRKELAIRKCWNDAVNGDRQKLELLWDRGWGKVPNQVDLTDWRKQALDAGAKIDDAEAIFQSLADEIVARSTGTNAEGSRGVGGGKDKAAPKNRGDGATGA